MTYAERRIRTPDKGEALINPRLFLTTFGIAKNNAERRIRTPDKGEALINPRLFLTTFGTAKNNAERRIRTPVGTKPHGPEPCPFGLKSRFENR